MFNTHQSCVYVIVIFFYVVAEAKIEEDTMDEFMRFFNVSDVSDVTWSHAVNSQAKLQQALSSDTMMLEADVLMRDETPIMAHPPDTDSDLTLAEFLLQTVGSSKGIKLDFKTIRAVKPFLKLIKASPYFNDIKNPIWLNADIIAGPCYDANVVPVDSETFLTAFSREFPKATLSVGWTTGIDMSAPQNFYSWTHVINMGRLVSHITQPVTFPIRAALVPRSWDQIHWLLSLSDSFTITIWSAARDVINPVDLVSLRHSIADRRRVFYDLPPDQAEGFRKALASTEQPASPLPQFSNLKWRAYPLNEDKDILVGKNTVLFNGRGGFVVSQQEYKLNGDMEVKGSVSFIDTDSSKRATTTPSITISLHSPTHQECTAVEKKDSGARLVLYSTGDFELFSLDGNMERESVSSRSNVFHFQITDSGQGDAIKTVVTGKDDKQQSKQISVINKYSEPGKCIMLSAVMHGGAILASDICVTIG